MSGQGKKRQAISPTCQAGETQAMRLVLAFPPKLSFSSQVSVESLYGTCLLPVASCVMTWRRTRQRCTSQEDEVSAKCTAELCHRYCFGARRCKPQVQSCTWKSMSSKFLAHIVQQRQRFVDRTRFLQTRARSVRPRLSFASCHASNAR